MKKLHSFIACTFVACLTLVLFSSCEEEIGGLAPKSIVGKTFDSYSQMGPLVINFTSSSSYTITNFMADHYIPEKYSYRKTGADTADLTIEYVLSEIYAGEHGIDVYIISLFFTTPETGWYVDDTGKHTFTLR